MKKCILLLLSLLLITPNPSQAETAKDAVRALKKLEARVSTGVSYSDYSPAVGDAKFEVEMFTSDTKEANKNSELTTLIKRTMDHYTFAGTVWSMKFAGSGVIQKTESTFPDGRLIRSKYPDAPIRKGFFDSGSIYFDEVISHIWTKAGKDLEDAMTLLSSNN